MSITLRCLRPYLRPRVQRASQAASSAYLSYYHAVRSYNPQQAPITPRTRTGSAAPDKKYRPEPYPRFVSNKNAIDYTAFKQRYKGMLRGESRSEELIVRGMSCFMMCSL